MAVTFHGMLDSAQALVKMQENRLVLVEKLNKSGNARRRELEKVKTDLAVAKARLLEAEEKQLLSQMELEVIRAQIQERKLRSPIKAIVLKVYKQQSEMALATDMEPVLTLVQLDPLMANFHFAVAAVADIRVGQTMHLSVAGTEVVGEIDFISPVIEAQSGTIAVRYRLQNPEGTLRSGDRIIYTAPNYKEK
jgi:multidrug efflux pump subunit AcrA (membrane-fusion protein)